MLILTVGHSTRPFDELLGLLQEHRVMLLADVRTIPRSRHNPQYNSDVLARSLAAVGLAYRHMPELGGLRKPRKDSVNMGWRNAGFRGFADYMQTPEFEAALGILIGLAEKGCVCIMCAEAVPWRCHRSLIGDALTVRGVEVRDILAPDKTPLHELTPFAEVHGSEITYPFTLEG
ncbi:MAG TPA: DUF488 domain-containing protein [Gammaproteobacteria bacterium]